MQKSILGDKMERNFYLNKLIEKEHNGMIKVITGIRRCGKSYLLNTLFYNHLLSVGVPKDHVIRFAFDSASDLEKMGESYVDMGKGKRGADPKKFLSYMKQKISSDGPYYLLLDEVQLLDGFEYVLNGYLREPNLDIYVTGSNAKFLSRDIITEFAGRGDAIHMYPLNFAEFMTAYSGDRYAGLTEYMLYGGLPLVVSKKNDDEKASMLETLFQEIYLRDIYLRHNVKNQDELEDLLNVISSGIGSLTNPEKLKKTFQSRKNSKITSATIKKYLGYLEDSFLVESASRYDIKGKEYIETPKKYYFSDLGLRNARLNFRQFEENHAMENVIYNELKIRGYRVDVGVNFTSEKEESGKQIRKALEVDFVCNKGSKRYYIQSAYSIPNEEKRNQEIRPLRKIDDSFAKMIITKDPTPPRYDEYGILTMSIYDFLLNSDSLGKLG